MAGRALTSNKISNFHLQILDQFQNFACENIWINYFKGISKNNWYLGSVSLNFHQGWNMLNYNETSFGITCIDMANSALAFGAAIARDSLDPLLSGSTLWPLPPPAPCLWGLRKKR